LEYFRLQASGFGLPALELPTGLFEDFEDFLKYAIFAIMKEKF
jgi:hypothetical protein